MISDVTAGLSIDIVTRHGGRRRTKYRLKLAVTSLRRCLLPLASTFSNEYRHKRMSIGVMPKD